MVEFLAARHEQRKQTIKDCERWAANHRQHADTAGHDTEDGAEHLAKAKHYAELAAAESESVTAGPQVDSWTLFNAQHYADRWQQAGDAEEAARWQALADRWQQELDEHQTVLREQGKI